MASFSVNINYTIDATDIAEDQVSVTFTLICTEASLNREFTEVYPHAMFYQNVDPEMDANDLQQQMKSNFLTLAKMTIEDFANEAKAVIRENQGETVVSDVYGTIAMNNPVIYFSYGTKPFSFEVIWN